MKITEIEQKLKLWCRVGGRYNFGLIAHIWTCFLKLPKNGVGAKTEHKVFMQLHLITLSALSSTDR